MQFKHDYAFIISFHISGGLRGNAESWGFTIDSKPQLKKRFSRANQAEKASI